MTDPLTSALGVRLAELTDDLTDTTITPGPVRERGRRLRARRRALGASVVVAVVAAGFGISSLVAAPRHDAIPAVPHYPRHGLQLDDVAGYSVWLDEEYSAGDVCASTNGADAGSTCKTMLRANGVQLVLPSDDHALAAGTIELGGTPVEGMDVSVQVEGHPAVVARSASDDKGRVLFAVPWRDLGAGPDVVGPVRVVARGPHGDVLAHLALITPAQAAQWSATTDDRSLLPLTSGSWAWSRGSHTCVGGLTPGRNDTTPFHGLAAWCGELGSADVAAPDYLIVPSPGDDPVRVMRVPLFTTSVTLDGRDLPLEPGADWTWVVMPGTTPGGAHIVVDSGAGKIQRTLSEVLVDGLVVGLS